MSTEYHLKFIRKGIDQEEEERKNQYEEHMWQEGKSKRSVSYTHLDVYKRQVLCLIIIVI